MSARTDAPLAVVAAEAAAESVRAINHALYTGLDNPGDAYTLVGHLAHLASMLPQALSMTRQAVERLERGGDLRSDRGTLANDLAAAYDGLEQAAADAQTLYGSINRAHASLGHIGTLDGGE
jgi:ribulose-5-phosphate 4-epimerase/fuculose-1-phosphate aldolase